MKNDGFTLIELLITGTVISILLLISVPAISSYVPHLKLKKSARKIVSVIRALRIRAITRNREQMLIFNIEENVCRLFSGDKSSGSTRWAPEGNVELNRYETSLEKITSFQEKRIVFNPDGTIEGVNGSVILRNTRGETCRITLVSSTGRVKIKNGKPDGKRIHRN